MRSKLKILIGSIAIPLLGGMLIGYLTGANGPYDGMVKPPLSPPDWVFPFVWAVLYIMMGYALYLVLISPAAAETRAQAKRMFASQLILNFLWPVIFFVLKTYWAAAVCLLALIFLIVLTMREFNKNDRRAVKLLIPYLVWCVYALYLNIGVAVLN